MLLRSSKRPAKNSSKIRSNEKTLFSMHEDNDDDDYNDNVDDAGISRYRDIYDERE